MIWKWAQSDFFSPTRCRWILAIVLFLGCIFRLIYLGYHCPIDLSGDEAQYWDWSRQLEWSYYSKGPGIAWLIRASCSIFGDTALAIRLPAVLLGAGTSVLTYWLTRKLFNSDKLALGTVLLTHCVWMFVAGSLLMTIDPPYYFCWGLATCLAYKALFDKSSWAWPLIGLCVGIGFLFKYAMFLWFISLFLLLFIHKPFRVNLRTTKPWIALVVAILCTAPVVYWNIQHHWIAFGHVARQTSENQSGFKIGNVLINFAKMYGSQIGILNPIIALFVFCSVIYAFITLFLSPIGPIQRAMTFILCMSLPFMAMVSIIPFFKSIEPNWPAPTYFTLMPLTGWFISTRLRDIRDWAVWCGFFYAGVGLGMIAIPLMHYTPVLYPLLGNPKRWDPASRVYGNADLGEMVSTELSKMKPGAFIVTEKYMYTALTAFYVKGKPKTFYAGSWIADPTVRDRYCQYDLWPDRDLDQPQLIGADAIYVGHDLPDIVAAFDRVEPVPDTVVIRNGQIVRTWRIFRAYGYKGMKRPTDGKTPR